MKAVKWATLQEVVSGTSAVFLNPSTKSLVPEFKDIITMSWSIEAAADDNRDELENFKLVLVEAAAKNIILFCAAPDNGNATAENLYPSCVLRIGATPSTSGSPEAQFIFPGEVNRINKAGGSSIATALAAGMAAMLLHCADIVMPEAVHKEYYTHAAILRAFEKMGGTPESALRAKEYFSYDYERDWQQKLVDDKWRDSLRLKMHQTGILGL